MIFDALTYSILAIGLILTYAVVHLTLLNGKPFTKYNERHND